MESCNLHEVAFEFFSRVTYRKFRFFGGHFLRLHVCSEIFPICDCLLLVRGLGFNLRASRDRHSDRLHRPLENHHFRLSNTFHKHPFLFPYSRHGELVNNGCHNWNAEVSRSNRKPWYWNDTFYIYPFLILYFISSSCLSFILSLLSFHYLNKFSANTYIGLA